jgi:CheY-like chemotaxis protein
LRFVVIDTGVGIHADKLEHIFLPFEQVGDAHHRIEGTGLGLTITRNLVEAMSGQLTVESEVGRGSTFRLDLEFPAVWIDAVYQAPLSEREVIGYEGGRRKLLVVDDKPSNRAILVNLLRPVGFEVFEAGNGEQAIEQALIVRPDAIFLDLLMPVMGGLEAAQQIRQNHELNRERRSMLIAMSSHAFEKDIVQSKLAGCDAFLTKPVEMEKLFALLAAQLNLTWLYRQPAGAAIPPIESSDDHLMPPPPAEMATLLDLALQGALPRLKQRALQIEQLDERYRPFVRRLCQLVDEFDEDGVLALIERYQKTPA